MFDKLLNFLKTRKPNKKIYIGAAGLVLFIFGFLFPEMPHYVVTVEYCEDKANRIGCEVVNADLFASFNNLLGGTVESAFDEAEVTPEPEVTPEG